MPATLHIHIRLHYRLRKVFTSENVPIEEDERAHWQKTRRDESRPVDVEPDVVRVAPEVRHAQGDLHLAVGGVGAVHGGTHEFRLKELGHVQGHREEENGNHITGKK